MSINMDDKRSTTSTLTTYRAKGYYKHLQHTKDHVSTYRQYAHSLSALLLTRAFILAPLERMKIVLQVKHIASFVNPKDMPTSALDLTNSNVLLS